MELTEEQSRMLYNPASFDSPDGKIIEALLDYEVLKNKDDGNGGLVKYFKSVSEIIRKAKHDTLEQYRKKLDSLTI